MIMIKIIIRQPYQNSPMDPIFQPQPGLHFLTGAAAHMLCPAMNTHQKPDIQG